jgi:hypothetical protein
MLKLIILGYRRFGKKNKAIANWHKLELKERLERVGCRSILLPPVFRVS